MPTLEEQIQALSQQLDSNQAPVLPQLPRQSRDDGGGGGWTGLLGDVGEVLSGGQSPTYRLRGSERAAAGSRALLNFGINMMMASGPQRVRPDLFSAFGSGLQGAQQSMDLDQRRAQAVAQQDYTQRMELAKLGVEQNRDKIERLKALIPLLQLQNRPIINPDGSVSTAGSGSGGTTATGAPGAIQFTGDKAKDEALIIARESKGDPTALNYVAREDPTARARGATASGLYGFTDTTWREGLAMVGGDAAKYPTAQSAPAEVQRQVFSAIYDKRGTAPWDPSKWGQNWVKQPDGTYALVKTGTGGSTAARPGGTTTATTPTAPPGVQVGGTPPAPPGSRDTGAYTGGGIGSVLNPAQAALPVPPPIPPEGIPVGNLGLRQLPNGTIVDSGAGGARPRRTAAADAIMEGVQTAQATPLVRGTGQEAGPSSAVAQTRPSYVPGQPDQGFGSGVGTYGSKGATSAAPAAPAATPAAPAQQPPPRPATGPLANLPTMDEFVRQNMAKPTPDEESSWRTPMSPDEEKNLRDGLKRLQSSVDAARASYNAAGSKDSEGAYHAAQKAYSDAEAELAKRQREALKVGDDRKAKWFEGERARLKDLYGELVKGNIQIQTADNAAANTRKTKVLEGIDSDVALTGDRISSLEALRVLSAQVGKGTLIGDIQIRGRSLADIISATGWGGPELQKKAADVQTFQASVNAAIKDIKSGVAMGAVSDRDLIFLENMVANPRQDERTRNLIITGLIAAQERKRDVAVLVGNLIGSGVSPHQAIMQAQKEVAPIFRQVPPEIDKGPGDRRAAWFADNVRPGQLYRRGDNTVDVYPGPEGSQ